MEAAKVLGSEVQIDGFDIEGRNFPRHPPSNVSFCLASVTELPSAWTNRYKFVHQSLLTAALQKPQWEIALSEIHRVLQPGGWVHFRNTFGRPIGESPRIRAWFGKAWPTRWPAARWATSASGWRPMASATRRWE